MLTQEEARLLKVAVPLAIRDLFTYRIPEHLVGRVQVGSRVRVPFRNRTMVGYAVGVDSGECVGKPKEVLEVLDPQPVVTDHLLRLAQWIAHYYFSSVGEVLQNMLPRDLRPGADLLTDSEEQANGPAMDREGAIQLNEEQRTAYEAIEARLRVEQFAEVFLFGVTGGGKSELYIRAIEEVLSQGKSAICLVPEIALTEQLERFFVRHFRGELEILHSRLPTRHRASAWHRIRSGARRVVLGARSAVFAPAPHLGLIIIDEEQEASYKQDQSPRYHAREVARWRAKDAGALLLMGTATPTLETFYRAGTEGVSLLTLSKRVDGRQMPLVEVIDLKRAQETMKQVVIFSNPLRQAMEVVLERKEGILLLLNRRGFSTHVRCLRCHDVSSCPRCAVTLTYHQEDQEVLCHYCNYHRPVPSVCPSCQHPFFKFSGIGTEKVESEAGRLFPKARIGRLDRDTVRVRGAHEGILRRFRSRQLDILIGTQMIAKGFDFQHVALVGIVNADTSLLLPDFRSAERTFQLITQMAGRAGRGTARGNVLIQTYSPEHYSIQCAAHHDYLRFFSEEIARRQTLRYPPWVRLINLIFRGKIEREVEEHSLMVHRVLEDKMGGRSVEVIGPAPLPLYRLRGHYRWHLMLRGEAPDELHSVLEHALEGVRLKKGVFLAIDVDPVAIL